MGGHTAVIQTALNGMITILLAKFMLNDVPHYLFEETTMRTLKVVRVDDRPATPGQLRYIAILCTELKMTVHYEERIKTFGEAGMMIRELEEERKYRRKLKSGNPAAITEAARRATIETSVTEFPATEDFPQESRFVSVVYDERGTPVLESQYDELEDKILLVTRYVKPGYAFRGYGTRSFIEGPLALSVRTGKPMTTTPLTDDGMAFYRALERKGIVTIRVSPELPHIFNMVPRGNPNTATGTCYEDAWRWLMKEESGTLIHGTVISPIKRMGHAWVETDTGFIWEPQTKDFFRYNTWQAAAEPIEEQRYTVEEAAIMVARTSKHGPWSAEERLEYIGR